MMPTNSNKKCADTHLGKKSGIVISCEGESKTSKHPKVYLYVVKGGFAVCNYCRRKYHYDECVNR